MPATTQTVVAVSLSKPKTNDEDHKDVVEDAVDARRDRALGQHAPLATRNALGQSHQDTARRTTPGELTSVALLFSRGRAL